MSVAIVISTYNWPEALEVCLMSLMGQTQMPDEVLIADDGSSPETTALIERWKKQISLTHAWQEDAGFRAASSRNNAIRQVKSDYVILVDGDMVMHPQFIEDHAKFAKKNYFVQGSRVLLSPDYTDQVTADPSNWTWDKKLIRQGILGNCKNLCRNKFLSWITGCLCDASAKDTRTCNMAFWREDLVAVNGFNNDYVGWGREDSDLAYRLVNYGCRRQKIKHAAVALHLYHDEKDRSSLEENDRRLQYVLENKSHYRCENGLVDESNSE